MWQVSKSGRLLSWNLCSRSGLTGAVSLAWFCLSTTSAQAGSGWFRTQPFIQPDSLKDTEQLMMAPFVVGDNTTDYLRLQQGDFALRGFDLSYIVNQSLNTLGLIQGVQVKQETTAFGLAGQSKKSFRFYVRGIPICRLQLMAHEQSGGQVPVIIGDVPRLNALAALSSTEQPDPAAALLQLKQTAEDFGASGHAVIQSSEFCFLQKDGNLLPVLDLTFEQGSVLYRGIADGTQAYEFHRHMFDAAGKAKIYPHNNTDADRQEFTLQNLTGTGALEDNHFYIAVDPVSGKSKVNKPDLNFDFDPAAQSAEFIQTSIFTNANRTLEWFKSIGYTDELFGTNQIKLLAHAFFSGDNNNALYKPGTSATTPPTILIGDGSNGILKNLGTDSDVVGHEFGHHVIYQAIQEIKDESLVLHEGLADFFNFIRTGDPCLGESICPANSPINCAVEEKCLRTAENELVYGDPALPTEAHVRSQFISGMLWDLTKKDGVPSEDVDKMVYGSLKYLVRNSGYAHFILGMMLADKDLFNAQYCQKIYARAEARGLTSKISSFSCSDALPSPKELTSGSSATSETSEQSSSSKKKKSGFCSAITVGSPANSIFVLILLFSLPLVSPMLKVRVKKNRK